MKDIIQSSNVSKEVPYCVDFSLICRQLGIKLENNSNLWVARLCTQYPLDEFGFEKFFFNTRET